MNQAKLVRVIGVVFFIAYPFIVYFGIQHLPASFFGLLLIAILAMRFGVIAQDERLVLLPLLLGLLAYSIAAVVLDSTALLLYYPALVNFSLCAMFANSLRSDESFLLRLVRARGIPISDHTPFYLHRLTALWAGFFVLNGIVSILTSRVSMEAWTLYNGFLSYFIIAILIGGEMLFRRHYKKRKSLEQS